MKLIIDLILITGLVLNIIVLIGVTRINNKETPHKILIVFWSTIAVCLLHFYSKLHHLDGLYLFTFLFANGARLFLAPLIYIYIKSIFSARHPSFIKKNLIHFIWLLIYLVIYIIPSVINHIKAQELFTHLSLIENDYVQGLFQDVFSIIYLIFSLNMFYSSRKKIKEQYSNIKQKDFLWIRNFVFCFSAVILIDILMIFLAMLFHIDAAELGFATVFVLIVSMVYLGYYGLTQSTIFLPDFLTHERKIKNHAIPDELIPLKEKLEHILQTEKPYLTPGLTLNALAKIVNTSGRNLSVIINDEMHTTFYDLINTYRVEEAKLKLTLHTFDKYSIAGIAETCGFNSKSSFYRIFKKETGLTPTQFKNSAN